MSIHPSRLHEIDATVARLLKLKNRLIPISQKTNVPWWIIAVILERESGGDVTTYLGNGQKLSRVTTEVPQGRGPFLGADAFERGCYDALIDCAPHASRWTDWTPGGALMLLELYNGLGYEIRLRPSPYIFGGTDQYVSGKFIRDHEYSALAVDPQIGCAPLISRMMIADESIRFADAPGKWGDVPATTGNV